MKIPNFLIYLKALVNEDFHYDCSNPSRKGIKSPFFPYTLDYGFQRMSDCQVQPCLKEGQNYPGFWEVPMNDLNVEYKIKNGNLVLFVVIDERHFNKLIYSRKI